MNKIAILSLGSLIVLAACFAADAHAVTYKYTDASGNVNFTDELHAVPEEYRATAVKVGGGPEEGVVPGEQQAAPSAGAVMARAGATVSLSSR